LTAAGWSPTVALPFTTLIVPSEAAATVMVRQIAPIANKHWKKDLLMSPIKPPT
jgi:hypothetical protein